MNKILPILFLAAATVFAEDNITDLNAFISQKIASGEKTVVVPSGTYRLKAIPGKNAHLYFENLNGVTIIGDGAELLFQDTANMIRIVNCKNFELRGFSLDTEPLAFTQGRIIKMSEDRMTLDIEVFSGYPTSSKKWGVMEIFNPETRILRTRQYPTKLVEPIGKNILRVTLIDALKNIPIPERIEKLGDIAVISNLDAASGISSAGCDKLTFKNITTYSSREMAYFDLGSKDTVFDSCKILRREKNDYVERGNPRLRSINADGYHARGAIRGPTLINCEAEFAGDDLVALEGVYHLVSAQNGRTLRAIVRDMGQLCMSAGDEIEIFKSDGVVLRAKVSAIAKAAGTTSEERAFISSWNFPPSFKKPPRMSEAFDITLDSDISAPRGSLIVSLSAACRGYKIIGGRFAYVRSRGMLLKASDGVVDGATIIGARMECIKIAPEHYWLEAAHSQNVVIKNCSITAGLGVAIGVTSPSADYKGYSPAGAHKNIKILNNDIKYFYPPCLVFTSIDGLEFRGNKISELKEPIYFKSWKDEKLSPAVIEKFFMTTFCECAASSQ